MKAFGQGDPALAAWAEQVYAPEDEVLREIRTRSRAAGLPPIQVGAMDGLHLEVLARAARARRAVEIGTLGGYSGVCLLRGMEPDGVLDTCELLPRHAEVARRSFELAGFASRARIHVGPARERLAAIEDEGPFDLVFVDADKENNAAYVELALGLSHPGTVIVVDNVVRGGAVVEADHADPRVQGTRALFDYLAREPRLDCTALQTVGVKGYDGFVLALVTS